MSSLLTVKNLDAGFGSNKVVKNISLEVTNSQVLALIGPSGCGKSTFLRCLNLMHQETVGAWVKGQVLLGDQDIFDPETDPVEIRRKVGMVFQKPNPFPSMTVFDNVVAGLLLRGTHKRSELTDTVEIALRRAALWDEVKDRLKKQATSLSGGQQQRLCIARALAVDPSVLLMDEPTSALDPLSTAKVEELVVELKNRVTIVMVTHNMQQARRVSDRTGFFLTGELVELNSTTEIFTNPRDSKTESYITGRFG
jgi:phosphate transport system ATP-binding protein